MYVLLVMFIFIFILVALKVFLDTKELFNQVPQYLHHKSRCFSCEKDMIDRHGPDAAWMANPSKTFSAEQDGIRQANGDISGGFLGKTMKYY
jgi:hypothetical protein